METQKLKIKKESITYKITIPSNIEKQIRYLCSQVSDVEWSGVLFYDYEGSFENKNLNIICKDIYVMDIGNATYTEFNISPDVCNYMALNPELLDCKTGLIHSHNHMETFFSGTDLSTLESQGSQMNNFVSLIVNNKGDYTAAITRLVTSTKSIKEFLSYGYFDNTPTEESLEEQNVEDKYIEYFYLDIYKEDDFGFPELQKRLEDIKENKRKDKPTRPTKISSESIFSTKGEYKDMPYDDFDYNFSNNDYNMANLFEDDNSYTKEKYSKEDFLELEGVSVDDSVLKSAIIQLITGSITLSSKSKLSLNDWINNMEKVYDKRFKNFDSFVLYADTIVDFIVYDILDDSLLKQGYEDTDIVSIYAYNMIKELETYKPNKYLKEFIQQLELRLK